MYVRNQKCLHTLSCFSSTILASSTLKLLIVVVPLSRIVGGFPMATKRDVDFNLFICVGWRNEIDNGKMNPRIASSNSFMVMEGSEFDSSNKYLYIIIL